MYTKSKHNFILWWKLFCGDSVLALWTSRTGWKQAQQGTLFPQSGDFFPNWKVYQSQYCHNIPPVMKIASERWLWWSDRKGRMAARVVSWTLQCLLVQGNQYFCELLPKAATTVYNVSQPRPPKLAAGAYSGLKGWLLAGPCAFTQPVSLSLMLQALHDRNSRTVMDYGCLEVLVD